MKYNYADLKYSQFRQSQDGLIGIRTHLSLETKAFAEFHRETGNGVVEKVALFFNLVETALQPQPFLHKN